MTMPTYVRDPQMECVITFGVAGWSGHFMALLPPGYDANLLRDTAQRMIPNDVKNTHPDNAKVKWIKLFRLESEVDLVNTSIITTNNDILE